MRGETRVSARSSLRIWAVVPEPEGQDHLRLGAPPAPRIQRAAHYASDWDGSHCREGRSVLHELGAERVKTTGTRHPSRSTARTRISSSPRRRSNTGSEQGCITAYTRCAGGGHYRGGLSLGARLGVKEKAQDKITMATTLPAS